MIFQVLEVCTIHRSILEEPDGIPSSNNEQTRRSLYEQTRRSLYEQTLRSLDSTNPPRDKDMLKLLNKKRAVSLVVSENAGLPGISQNSMFVFELNIVTYSIQ